MGKDAKDTLQTERSSCKNNVQLATAHGPFLGEGQAKVGRK